MELEAEPMMSENSKRIIEEMNGMKTMFVIQKRLTQKNVVRVNNQSSISKKQMRNYNFVEEKEMEDS